MKAVIVTLFVIIMNILSFNWPLILFGLYYLGEMFFDGFTEEIDRLKDEEYGC